MGRYEFVKHPQKEQYLLVLDHGTPVAELWEEHALVAVTMYHGLFNRDQKLAEEFMYGHLLGMSLMMLHADRYPRVTVTTGPSGEKILRAEDPVLGTTFDGPAREAPGAQEQAQEMFKRADIAWPFVNKGVKH